MLLRVESTTLPELDGKDLITTTATINGDLLQLEGLLHRVHTDLQSRTTIMYSNMLDLSIQDMKASTTRVPINVSFDRNCYYWDDPRNCQLWRISLPEFWNTGITKMDS